MKTIKFPIQSKRLHFFMSGYNMSEMARKAHIDRPKLYRIRDGELAIQPKEAEALVRVIGINILSLDDVREERNARGIFTPTITISAPEAKTEEEISQEEKRKELLNRKIILD